MQSNVGLGGKTVVTGLVWSVLTEPVSGRNKEIKKACEDSGLSFGVVIDSPESSAIGLCPKKADYPSAAALFAAASAKKSQDKDFASEVNSWIIIEKVTSSEKSDQYWLCAVTDGVPVLETDIVDDLTVISAKLAEILDFLEQVEIFSPNEEIQEYVGSVMPATNKGFIELTSDISLPKNGHPQKLKGVQQVVWYGVAAAAALVVGGVGYSFYSDYQVEQAALAKSAKMKLAKAQQDALNKAQQDEEYKQSLARVEKMAVDKMATALKWNPKLMTVAWASLLETLPLNHGGWSVQTVACDASSCVVNLERDLKLGTNESLLEIQPQAIIVGNKAVYSIAMPGDIVNPVSAAEGEVLIKNLQRWEDFSGHTISQLQTMILSSIDATVGNPKDETFMPPPLPEMALDPKEAAAAATQNPNIKPATNPRRLGFASGVATIKGLGVWKIKELSDLLEDPGFSLRKLSVNFGGNLASEAAWGIDGEYYVKAPNPIELTLDSPNAITPNMETLGKVPAGVGPQPPQNEPLKAMPTRPTGGR